MKMDDIARMAGVSASTVSRALNDSPLVAEATKARIIDIARRLDYQVDPYARSLRLRRTGTVAVIVPIKTEQPLSDPFFSELLGAIADGLTDQGYRMLLAKVPSIGAMGSQGLNCGGAADGTILIGQSTEHADIDMLAGKSEPLVVWGHQFKNQRYHTVGSDNEAGGFAVGQHLRACGYENVAFLGDPLLPEVDARLTGLRRGLGTRQEAIVASCPFIGQAGFHAAKDLLTQTPSIDAIFAASDLLATSVIGAAHSIGRRVPDDLAVVGFDDIQLASYHHPSLTTVRQDIRTGARTLVEKLLALLDGQTIESSVLPIELVERQTTQLPKGD